MKKLLLLMLLMPVMAYSQVREDGSFRTVLKGTVTGGEGKKLYVMKSLELDREVNNQSIIPIVNGRFEYVLEGNYLESYELCLLDEFLAGSFSYLEFYPDAEIVEFTIDDLGFLYNNTVSGGESNRAMNEFKAEENRIYGKRQDALRDEYKYLEVNKLYFTSDAMEIMNLIEEIIERDDENAEQEVNLLNIRIGRLESEGKLMTHEAIDFEKKNNDFFDEIKKWRYEYMTSHPCLYGYSLLLKDISSYRHQIIKPEIDDMERAYVALSAANPNHPYNQKAADGINALKTLSPGAMFIDFTAPTLEGQMHTLSEEIKGKIALIDLWASWCGSCRRGAMRIIPIYEKYKDRGFTVVGVAREFKTTNDLVIALRRDGYPWLNLLELDDRAGIWMKYGANNAGGRTILVDENGRIVKLDVTAEDVEEYLSSRLD